MNIAVCAWDLLKEVTIIFITSTVVWSQLNIRIISGPITSWEIDEETVETVSDFIFGGSKITADVDCSHEIKRCYSLEEKL